MKFDPDKLINLRWDKRLNQTQLAKMIGVKPPVLWCWEAGRHVPSARLLLLLASALGVTPQYFFDDSVSSKNNKKAA